MGGPLHNIAITNSVWCIAGVEGDSIGDWARELARENLRIRTNLVSCIMATSMSDLYVTAGVNPESGAGVEGDRIGDCARELAREHLRMNTGTIRLFTLPLKKIP